MLWLLLLAGWLLVAVLVGLVLGRSIAIEEDHAARDASELAQRDPEPAGADTDPGYALTEQG